MQKRSVVRSGLYVSGNANNGTNAGAFYANANNAPSNTNANRSSRKYFQQEKEYQNDDPASWQKMTICE